MHSVFVQDVFLAQFRITTVICFGMNKESTIKTSYEQNS
jgi:hypothetical protein